MKTPKAIIRFVQEQVARATRVPTTPAHRTTLFVTNAATHTLTQKRARDAEGKGLKLVFAKVLYFSFLSTPLSL